MVAMIIVVFSTYGDDVKKNSLIIWNQHNADYNDRGTKTVRIIFYSDDKEVYKLDNQELSWAKGVDSKNVFSLPNLPFDKVRIEILAKLGHGGGLSEVEIIKDGVNIARNAKVSVSGVFKPGKEYQGENLVDGITTSKENMKGYWLMPDAALGWCELNLNTPPNNNVSNKANNEPIANIISARPKEPLSTIKEKEKTVQKTQDASVSPANSRGASNIVIDGVSYKDVKITTDETAQNIELKHSEGARAYNLSDFPAFNIGMKDGTVVEKAKLTEINPAGITVMFSKGVKGLKFEDMNEEYKSFFGYDVQKAEDYLNKISQAQAERIAAKQQQAELMKKENERLKAEAERQKLETEKNKNDLAKQTQSTQNTNKSSQKGTNCNRCKGSGMIGAGPPGPMFWSETKPCPYCNGTGKVNR